MVFGVMMMSSVTSGRQNLLLCAQRRDRTGLIPPIVATTTRRTRPPNGVRGVQPSGEVLMLFAARLCASCLDLLVVVHVDSDSVWDLRQCWSVWQWLVRCEVE